VKKLLPGDLVVLCHRRTSTVAWCVGKLGISGMYCVSDGPALVVGVVPDVVGGDQVLVITSKGVFRLDTYVLDKIS
jgi:hypothetical protein